MWKTGLRLAAGLSMLACLVQAPAASAAPIACPQATVFVAQNQPTQLFAQRYGAGGATFEAIGAPAAFTYNALAYNPVDGSLYAMNNTADPARLIQIQSNGSTIDLGTIAGLPSGVDFLLGTFDDAGRFYIARQVQAEAYVVNITTRTATPLPIPAAPGGADWAYIDGYLWAGRGANVGAREPDHGRDGHVPVPGRGVDERAVRGRVGVWQRRPGHLRQQHGRHLPDPDHRRPVGGADVQADLDRKRSDVGQQ